MILDHQRVGELDPEATTVVDREFLELVDELEAPIHLQIGIEVLGPQHHLVISELVVDDLRHSFEAQQGGVELYHHVEVVSGHEVFRDRLDLVRRATVEGRERRRVCDTGWERVPAPSFEGLHNFGSKPFDRFGGVGEAVDELCDAGIGDACKVVSDGDVEDMRAGIGSDQWGEFIPVPQNLDDHPGLYVFVE